MSEKREILVLCHSTSLGGAELALASLVESTKDTYNWQLVFTEKKTASARLTGGTSQIHYLELPWWCYEAHNRPRKISKKQLEANLKQLEKLALSADYLLSNTITMPWLGLLAHKLNKPHVWYIHEFGDVDHNLQFILGYKKSLEIIAACSHRVLTISNAVKNHLSSVISANQIDIIHQSIDLKRLVSLPAVNIHEGQKLRLLCLGAIKPSKGQHIATSALKYLPEDFKAELDIVGPSADVSYVSKLSQLTSDNLHVQVRPYDPYDELANHDVVLMCSENEALGRVTLESLAAGRIVIGFDCEATRELLKDNRGIPYSPNTPEALAEKIKDVRRLSKTINILQSRSYLSKAFGDVTQASDFSDCLQKTTTIMHSLDSTSLATYIHELHKQNLFLSPGAKFIQIPKRAIVRSLPPRVKKIIKGVLPKPN